MESAPTHAGTERETMLEGIACFNRREYFEAHDVWERLWLARAPGGRTFVQSLIQLAAAYHNIARGKASGAGRLFEAALRRLGEFPPGWAGIDRTGLVAAAARHRESMANGRPVEVSDFPQIVILDEHQVTPGDR
ncbi:MAG: DUF309 domain-containing protein [Thermoanaerobaculia bacterium]